MFPHQELNPMRLTIEIHDAWLTRPEDLRKILATLSGLEDPPTATGPAARTHDRREEPSEPEGRPRSRNGRYSGDDDRSQASDDDDTDDEQGQEEDPPTDGRQLLGWAAKQVPDAKGMVIGYGKKRGYPSRILDWTPQQVDTAYRFARSRPARCRR
jgi:hypothetical protein